ncbi:dGTPase [Hasllibacter halocynthiae]|uniref:Deoxyguanosinetriphosphate triphosphohydrolase-like protein n=1 Tax=Hasllibacter halocynthiae TaxID=595589 RepID=A0A2T0X7N1_9RHOB|nr:deoxyguanosinetriphosphate triphosphohydrolase [Hasllibacter halocynthiae]PRY94884.1 dGTPase [Hasllibacter halocynthiae]
MTAPLRKQDLGPVPRTGPLPAPACRPDATRGRLHDEEDFDHRGPFQRDRDRIIHASAFRRLKHKTQVFLEHEGDHYRTRLTHSIEVAQVARTIARALGLNEDLAEAVALAHDLGHTPFGHTGEDALSELMAVHGGFDHNAQAIRIVTRLERSYARFDGLNLTWETLEGIAKHNGPVPAPLPWALAEYDRVQDLELTTHASAEAQVAALSDDVAYNNHDIQDGLRARLFTEREASELPLVGAAFAEVGTVFPGLDARRRRAEALRRVFGAMVADVIETSRTRIREVAPTDADAVRRAGVPVIRFSDAMWADLQVIRAFLFTRMYRAPAVIEMRTRVTGVVRELFPIYLDQTSLLPREWQDDVRATEGDATQTARLVSDYVAGMTDRFALREWSRLTGRALG